MGYCLTVYLDDLDKLQKLLNSGNKDVSMLSGIEPPVIDGIKRSLNGDDTSDLDAAGLINGFAALCKHSCTKLGQLDHFNYEEKDFPELWNFQWGDTSSPMNIPVADEGIPAMGHLIADDIAALLRDVQSIDLTKRPEYVAQPIIIGENTWSTPVKVLENWLTKALEAGKGLIHFYE